MKQASQAAASGEAHVPAAARMLFFALIVSLGFMRIGMPIGGLYAVLTDLLFLVTFIFWIAAVALGQLSFRWHPFYWLLLLYFAAMTLSAAASPDPERSFFKLATQAYLLTLPVLARNLLDDIFDLHRVFLAWIGVTVLVLCLGVAVFLLFYLAPGHWILSHTLFHFGSLPPGNYPRLSLTFGNSNMLNNYLAVSLGLILTARKLDWVGATTTRILIGVLLFCALLTFSPGLGGIALLLGLWHFAVLRAHQPRLAALWLIGGLGAALAFLFISSVTLHLHGTAPFFMRIPLTDLVLAPSGRLMLWMDSWRTFLGQPITGAGLGLPSAEVFFMDPSERLQFLTDAHNTFLNVAAQAGLPGLLAIVLISAAVIRRLLPLRIRSDDDALRVGLALAFTSSFAYQGLTGSFEDARHLWLLLGLVLCADDFPARAARPAV